MNYWVFVVKGRKIDGETLTSEVVFKQRMKDEFWGINKNTPNRKSLTKGDKMVCYLAMPTKAFAGKATFASSCFKLNDSHWKKYGHGKQYYMSDYGVLLEEVDTWNNLKPVEQLVPHLEFIENKEFWFSYFQGGIRQVAENDFKTILGERNTSLLEQIGAAKDVESQSEFALETHLEEFIYRNWTRINWGAALELYTTDERDGRQFPAGTWSIDFLAVDKESNDLVVIELKRGKTSDSTVGQLLRYITWTKENIAERGQSVRGIIIAKDVDEALNYAIRDLGYVKVKTYKVDFELLSFGS